jgi:hypothetical protein
MSCDEPIATEPAPRRGSSIWLPPQLAATFISTKRALSPIGNAVGALAGLAAGLLAHPPYAFYLTYVISAWKP